MFAACRTKTGDAMAKLVLIALADRANDDGECWPSLEKLVEDCETSKSTIIRKLAWLQDQGFIKRIHRAKDGMKTSNLYRLPLAVQAFSVVSDRHIDVSERHQGSVTVTHKAPIETPNKNTGRFTPPTVQELIDYIEEKNYYYIDPKDFIDFYESKNWMVGKNKMSKWKAAASRWHRAEKKRQEAGRRGRI